jgi:hypothetical protein
MAKNRNTRAAIQEATALAEAAVKQAKSIRETSAALLQASGDAAVRPSEVLGGLIGGAGAAAVAIYLIGLTSLSAVSIPFIAAAGLGAGVLANRGPRGIAADRERRLRAITAASDVDRPRLLREEIEAARLAGAPDEVIQQMWLLYAGELAMQKSPQLQLPAPSPQLSLPPGPPSPSFERTRHIEPAESN